MPGLRSRRDVPAPRAALKPSWQMALGRYDTEPLLTIVTCLLDGTISKQARTYKWILVTVVSPFCSFTHMYIGAWVITAKRWLSGRVGKNPPEQRSVCEFNSYSHLQTGLQRLSQMHQLLCYARFHSC